MRRRTTVMLALVAVAALAGCEREVLLTGERIAVRDTVSGAVGGPGPSAGNAVSPVALGPAVTNAEWTQPGGNAMHRPGHVALGAALTPIWSAPIGTGDSERARITAEPVVTGGRVFTLDSAATVTATSTAGQTLWQASARPGFDNGTRRDGGGLAVAGTTLYVTTGYGELIAMDTASGTVRWRQRFDGPVASAPAVEGDRVYVVARDASAWAIQTSDGKVIWTLTGAPSVSGVSGGAAPAVGAGEVVFPFSSGELIAVRKGGGGTIWTADVVGKRRGRAWSAITDITSDPVIVGDTVYAGNQSGRTVALDTRTGEALWQAEEGSYGPVAVAGNAIFLVNDEAHLVRLDSTSGQTLWSQPLPYFTDTKEKRRAAIYVNYGPILAGGRLIVASSDGALRAFDPASGALVAQVGLPGGAASAPAIAGGVLYVVTRSGRLIAYR